ncbi:POTRA domain-containing protein [Psychroserpens sp. BH13MA-6]
MLKKIHLIYVFLFFSGWHPLVAQNIYLKVTEASKKGVKTIDSIGYQDTFKDYLSLKQEVDNLQSKLVKAGFIESELMRFNKTNDSSYVAHFNLKIKYQSLVIQNTEMVDAAILKLTGFMNKNNALEIPIAAIESTMQLINSQLANRGNPFSYLIIDNIEKLDATTLSGTLNISKQQSRQIDKLVIKGYEKFPRAYMSHYLKIKTGQSFNLEKIKQQTAAFNDLAFASQIKEPEVLFTQDSTILYMYIDKSKSNTFDGFLGFGTNESTNKIEFDGYLDLNLTNNLNYGESLKLLYKSDENDQQTFDLRIGAPFIFSSPIGLDLNLNIFKRDSSFVTVTQAAKINYQINSKHLISTGINSVTSTNLLDDLSDIQDYKSQFYNLNYIYTDRQNYDFLFPINFLFDISGGIGQRTFGDVKQRQSQFALNTFKIINLNDKNSLYGRISSNYLISDAYLENELPRFGGINSIRGFEENSLIANLFMVLNTEYRYKLNNTIYIHSVIDAAYYENQIASQKGKLFGFGFGFGLLTKAGLFRFNYTSGKTEDQKFRLSDSKIHLSLTTRF